MPLVNAEDIDIELQKIATVAGKAVSKLVTLSLADGKGGVKWSPDRFIAMEMSYTNALIRHICESTQEVVSDSVEDMLKAMSVKQGSALDQLKGYMKDMEDNKS